MAILGFDLPKVGGSEFWARPLGKCPWDCPRGVDRDRTVKKKSNFSYSIQYYNFTVGA